MRLTDNTTNMASTILQPMAIKVDGDASNARGWVPRGLPQGYPVGLCLLNLFMDGYTERLWEGMRHSKIPEQDRMLTMFADVMKINAIEPQTLQKLLALSERWSTSNDMSWSTSKCTILTPSVTDTNAQYTLSGKTILTAKQTRYLGYEITSNRVLAQGSAERLKMGKQRLSTLKQAVTSMRNMESPTLVNICNTFVMSTAPYGIHMTPQDRELGKTWIKLEKDIII